METETVENQRSDIVAELSRPFRKSSVITRQPPRGPSRKISSVMLASESFREGLGKVGSDRPGRKISMNWAVSNMSDDKFNKAAKTQQKMENTYQLEPENTFPCCAVQAKMFEVLERHLQGMEYDAHNSPHKAKIISEDIKSKVKAMNVGRYRIVCLVHIGCNKGQELKIVSRSLWNPNVDTFATADFKSKNLFAVATVYGVYFE